MLPKTRTTALITGASSGIGLALARRFALAGHDLVIVSRDERVLSKLASEIIKGHLVRVHIVVLDLSELGAAQRLYDNVRAAGISIDFLVNNAGFTVHGDFLETSSADEHRMVNLQIHFLMDIHKLFVPAMKAARQGRILNVASVYSFAPVPYQAIYGACKTFMYSFSAALADELRGDGISISVLAPGSVRTALRQRAGVHEKVPGGKGMPADLVAEHAYRGMVRGQHLIVPGGWNRVFTTAVKFIPRVFIAPILRRINGVRGLAGTRTLQ